MSRESSKNIGNTRGRQKASYKSKLRKHKRKNKIRLLVIVLLLAVIFIGGKLYLDYRHYHSYKVTDKVAKQEAAATRYEYMGEDIFRYSSNGASLMDVEGNSLWNQTFSMQDPQLSMTDNTAAVYEKKGNQIYIFNKEKMTGNISTQQPILKARVSKAGILGAILQDGETTWINFYKPNGQMIASGKTRVDNPGYPVDLSISEDGLMIMVSYLFVEEGETTSYVAFYNLGEDGQDKIDNIVSSYRYKGKIVPEVSYMKDDLALAFKEDGFIVFSGKKNPKEVSKVTVKDEIVSTFHDKDYVGFVTRNEKEDAKFSLSLYSTRGKQIFKKDFNIPYDTVKINKGEIFMQNGRQLCVYSAKGIERYNGTIQEGNLSNIFKLGYNRYLLILDDGYYKIKFK